MTFVVCWELVWGIFGFALYLTVYECARLGGGGVACFHTEFTGHVFLFCHAVTNGQEGGRPGGDCPTCTTHRENTRYDIRGLSWFVQ